MYMFKLIRPLLFSFKDPETAHNLALSFLKLAGLSPFASLANFLTQVDNAALRQQVFGLDFKNPVGLAGGFDKHGEVLKGLEALGFGFLETGTITKLPQPGNPRQRIFRLNEDLGIINRLGFNNAGAEVLAKRLSHLNKIKIPIGISLGKSKITGLADSAKDYLFSLQHLYPYGDYFAINVSSPNTPGLRDLQGKEYLMEIVSLLLGFSNNVDIKKPILLKIAPDLSVEAINEVLEICKNFSIDGIIATNTTLSREGLKSHTNEAGGLSGAPLRAKSTEVIRYIHKQMPALPIIGVGGIFTAADAYEKIKAGASLVQIYTGFIYEGPMIVKKINKGLVELLKRDGFKNISEAVGVDPVRSR